MYFENLTHSQMKQQLNNILNAAKKKSYPDEKTALGKIAKDQVLNHVAGVLDKLAKDLKLD